MTELMKTEDHDTSITPFPTNDSISTYLPLRLRRQLAKSLQITPSFLDTAGDMAFDSDGTSLFVRGKARGKSDGFLAIPTEPSLRTQPTYIGGATISAWFATPPFIDHAPAVVGLDLKTVADAHLAGCAATMLCGSAQTMHDKDPSRWNRRMHEGVAALLARQHADASCIVIASSPSMPMDQSIWFAIAGALDCAGYRGPILDLTGCELGDFYMPQWRRQDRLLAFIEEGWLNARRTWVPRALLLDRTLG